jgi:hypothetical protein
MIALKGTYGIKNLYLPNRCDVCGKMREINWGQPCVRCSVWTEHHKLYLFLKYLRFSIRKYVYREVPKPRSIPI